MLDRGALALTPQPDVDAVSWADLDTRGFLVIRDFLSAREVVGLRRDYATSQLQPNKNYPLKAVSSVAEEIVAPKIDAALASINAMTALKVHLNAGSAYFETGTKLGVNFPWHQDHESYFLFQQHTNYLNFYMPIVKPDEHRSNVSIIPFDDMEREFPEAHRLMLGNGACHLLWARGRHWRVSDETGAVHLMPKGFQDLAVTPHLAAGDLLVMRGDAVHRTQDADTARVALSCRRVGKDAVITRKRLASGGVQKALMMSNLAQAYQYLWACFDAAGRDELSLEEMSTLVERVDPGTTLDRRPFVIRAMREKRRTHELAAFVADVPRAALVRAATKAQRRITRLRRV